MTILINFFASIRLTIGLLVASIVLVFLATLDQQNWGVWHVQDAYFESWGVLYPLSAQAKLHFPLPGGFLLGTLLVVNLLTAHFRYYRPGWQRVGISLIHAGLVMLLIGGFAIAHYQDEAAMVIPEGESRNFTEAFRECELVVIDTTDAKQDRVTAFSESMLTDGLPPQTIEGVRVEVLNFYPNAALQPVAQNPNLKPLQLKNPAGVAQRAPLGLQPVATSYDDNRPNNPVAIVRLSQGREVAEIAASLQFQEIMGGQRVTVGNKSWEISVRRQRDYLPFAIELRKFTHDRYPGTDIPKRFASDITLRENNQGTEFTISMNQPLRHGGLTFYQSSFGESNGKSATVLQVVRNPADWMPYVAVAVMSLGLLLHFILRLIRFLNERRSVVALLCALLATPAAFGQANPSLRNELSSELGRLPVQWNGRVIPVDILAANTLLQIRGRRTVALDETDRVIFGKPRTLWTESDKVLVASRRPSVPENVLLSIQQRPIQLKGSELTATEWLAETCFRPWIARHLKVFRVDHIGAQALLGRPNGDTKWYSWDEILTHVDAVSLASKTASERAQPTRDAFDRAVLNLDAAARAYAATSLTFIPPDLPPEITPSQEYLAWLSSLQKAAQEIETLRKKDPTSRGFDPQLQEVIRQLIERYRDISKQGTVGIVPRSGKNTWSKLGDALLEVTEGIPLDKPAVVPNYALLAESWRTGDDTIAHKSLSDLTTLLVIPETSRVLAESNFARLQPFYWILISYLVILLAILVHWTTGVAKIHRYCVIAGWTVFALHTAAILARMLIHGYAPVTNLYGSTIFVAWGAALLGLLLESTWRNGLGVAAAAAAGFGSLILAHNLALSGEDALESVRAVLDSNFWLSTHVTIVTLGYSAMFVAGMLATFHLIGRLLPRYTEETAQRLAPAAYGILAFATIASFIGTMLGGIWADQSWGRFWGWDPKENGALLIVLWCAVALHARWGKLVDREGFMQLLVFGNIVTAWSWFGTNLLGVGLHSYGFTEAGFLYLAYFVLSQLAIIALGWLPAANRPKQHA